MKNKLIHILESMDNVEFAYLFGSYAVGTYTDSSDVDIAIYLSVKDLDSRLAIHHEIERAIGKDVDMVCLNDAKNIYLLESILSDHIVIKDSAQRPIYEVHTQHVIIDFKNFKRYLDAA